MHWIHLHSAGLLRKGNNCQHFSPVTRAAILLPLGNSRTEAMWTVNTAKTNSTLFSHLMIAYNFSKFQGTTFMVTVYTWHIQDSVGCTRLFSTRVLPDDLLNPRSLAQTVRNLPAMQNLPGLGRSLGEGNGNPLQYSCLGNPMVRGAYRAIVHGVAELT